MAEILKDYFRRRLWLLAIRWIEKHYAGSHLHDASSIVDLCLALREGLENEG